MRVYNERSDILETKEILTAELIRAELLYAARKERRARRMVYLFYFSSLWIMALLFLLLSLPWVALASFLIPLLLVAVTEGYGKAHSARLANARLTVCVDEIVEILESYLTPQERFSRLFTRNDPPPPDYFVFRKHGQLKVTQKTLVKALSVGESCYLVLDDSGRLLRLFAARAYRPVEGLLSE